MASDALTLSTASQALAMLKDMSENDNLKPDEILFNGELACLQIKIVGSRYHGSFPSTLARELWNFQESFYRAVLFALNRPENLQYLTPAEKEKYLIVFDVQEGSLDLKVLYEPALKALSEALNKMDSKDKANTIIGIALMVSVTVGTIVVSDNISETSAKRITANIEIEKEKEKTEQFKVIQQIANKNAVVNRFAKAINEGSTGILRGSKDAESVEIGANEYDEDDIAQASERKPRAVVVEELVTDSFRVSESNFRHEDLTKYTLKNSDGVEFQIEVNHLKFKDEKMEKLETASVKRRPINLTVRLEYKHGKVKFAELVKIN